MENKTVLSEEDNRLRIKGLFEKHVDCGASEGKDSMKEALDEFANLAKQLDLFYENKQILQGVISKGSNGSDCFNERKFCIGFRYSSTSPDDTIVMSHCSHIDEGFKKFGVFGA